VLDVRPTSLTNTGHVKTITSHDEINLTLTEQMIKVIAGFHRRVTTTATEFPLNLLNRFGKCYLCEFMSHDTSPVIEGVSDQFMDERVVPKINQRLLDEF
jgi:hypothetical protein